MTIKDIFNNWYNKMKDIIEDLILFFSTNNKNYNILPELLTKDGRGLYLGLTLIFLALIIKIIY